MEKQKMQFEMPAGTKEVVFREGKAPEINNPRPNHMKGILLSVLVFAQHRKPSKDTTIVTLNRANMWAKLQVDPHDALAPVIEGSLTVNPALEAFNVNDAYSFKREQFVAFLKENRFFFPDKDAHGVLVSSIQNFEAKVSADIKQSHDSRGSRASSYEKRVSADGVPLSTRVKIPIFEGEKARDIVLDVCYHESEGAMRFWFESGELYDAIETAKNELFDKLVEGLNEGNYLMIEQ